MTTSTVRDPLYRRIVEGLSQPLVPAVFERVAVDLLRRTYPGLVPIAGGSDRGMDGAISAPGGGPAVPLVCTTSKEVPRNLAKNLKSYLANGGASREVVLVTSHALTGRRRQNLEKGAGDLGFELRNVHDQTDLAGRLYDDPDRRLELLGVTGRLPALSVYPLSRPGGEGHKLLCHDQPFAEDRLLGRDEDLEWLRAQKADFVLVGQPGVGKRSLLRILALEGRGLFVVSNVMEQVAEDYRAEQPEFLFLDDAHLQNDLLKKVLRMRRELRAPFQVAATTWPSRRARFEFWDIREIGPVSLAVAVKIVRSVGHRLRNELVAEIASQSRCRPGLAVALSEHSAAHWDTREGRESFMGDLAKGQLLLRQVERRASLAGRELDMLAHFALGGRQGTTLARVAAAMELPETNVREMLRRTAVTGLIEEIGTRVAIVGQALRSALLGRTFFDGAFSLSVHRAIDATTMDSSGTTLALICAMSRGHAIPHELVRQQLPNDLANIASRELWQQYARTGRDAVQWMIDHHPCKIPCVADSALEFAPRRALRLLIGSLSRHDIWDSHTSFSAIESWIRESSPGSLTRRVQLLDALMDACDDGPRNMKPSLFQLVFSLELRSPFTAELPDCRAPAREDGIDKWDKAPSVEVTHVTFSVRAPSPDDVRRLHGLWQNRAVSFLRTTGVEGVSAARNIAASWASAPAPSRLGSLLPSESASAVRECVAGMVADVVALADGRDGIVMWAKHLADCFDVPIASLPPVDPHLEQLFSLGHDADALRQRRAVAHRIGDKLAREDPATGIDALVGWQAEADLTGRRSSSRALEAVVHRIAETAPNPGRWLAVLASRQVVVDWASPFLDAALASGHECTEAWQALLTDSRYDNLMVQAAIHHHGKIPKQVVERVVEQLPKVGVPWELADWESISDAWQLRILMHRDRQTAAAAAGSIFQYRSERSLELSAMTQLVLTAWRSAVLESADEDLLQQVFVADPEVARECFLMAQPWVSPALYQAAADVLGDDDKRRLVEALGPNADPAASVALGAT